MPVKTVPRSYIQAVLDQFYHGEAKASHDGMYWMGTAYLADDLTPERRADAIEHEYGHHLFDSLLYE